MGVGVLAVRHDPSSAALVRRSISDDLQAAEVCSDSIDDVVLVASELVGNAVIHAPAVTDNELDVQWDVESDCVVVRVQDGSVEPPRRRTTTETETGGRGLTIVAALARDWGVRCSDGGKQVWARIPISRD